MGKITVNVHFYSHKFTNFKGLFLLSNIIVTFLLLAAFCTHFDERAIHQHADHTVGALAPTQSSHLHQLVSPFSGIGHILCSPNRND